MCLQYADGCTIDLGDLFQHCAVAFGRSKDFGVPDIAHCLLLVWQLLEKVAPEIVDACVDLWSKLRWIHL